MTTVKQELADLREKQTEYKSQLTGQSAQLAKYHAIEQDLAKALLGRCDQDECDSKAWVFVYRSHDSVLRFCYRHADEHWRYRLAGPRLTA